MKTQYVNSGTNKMDNNKRSRSLSQLQLNNAINANDLNAPETPKKISSSACDDYVASSKQLLTTTSTSSLNEIGRACAPALTHHYHYIQYPNYYKQIKSEVLLPAQAPIMQAQISKPPTTTTATATTNNNAATGAYQCNCTCSCGQSNAYYQQQSNMGNAAATTTMTTSAATTTTIKNGDSKMAVAVVVHHHHQSGQQQQQYQHGNNYNATSSSTTTTTTTSSTTHVTKAQSEQSLLNHSYQALQQIGSHETLDKEKPLNVFDNERRINACDNCHGNCKHRHQEEQNNSSANSTTNANVNWHNCNVECTCGTRNKLKAKHFNALADAMLGVDEITVSESDNNSTIIKKKKTRQCCPHINEKQSNLMQHKCCSSSGHYDSSKIDIYNDSEIDGIESCLKGGSNDDGLGSEDNRPPLPPRPPPRPRYDTNSLNASLRQSNGIKKYVVWCLVLGGFSCVLGVLFLGVYFLLHSYTITVGNFETVPTFVPATLQLLMGLCIMSLARRRNRYSYLIKLSGICGLVSVIICALVTVTTTVQHMTRLQALRECEYAQKTRTCTCYSDAIDSQIERVDREGIRLVFDSLSDCGVVHGSLYTCLRAIFGLSVAGVLISILSCMLVYQLLSHERKKMYWEQLELRCRSLYTSQHMPHHQPPSVAAAMHTAPAARSAGCRCCDQCHVHRPPVPMPMQPSAYPWDENGEPRFWPGQPQGNFYSPNPGGDEHALTNVRSTNTAQTRSNRSSGWSWPRMPWQRNSPVTNTRFRPTPTSPDSHYGFSLSTPAAPENVMLEEHPPVAPAHNAQAFSVVATPLPYGVWGPPPPYSDPNSPARRNYYQYLQANACANAGTNTERTFVSNAHVEQLLPCHSHTGGSGSSGFMDQATSTGTQTLIMRSQAKRQTTTGSHYRFKTDYENAPSDSDGIVGGGGVQGIGMGIANGSQRERTVNTLPTRKVKKRPDGQAIKSISANGQPIQRVNVQHVFANSPETNMDHNAHELQLHEGNTCINQAGTVGATTTTNKQMHKQGIENTGFQANGDCVSGQTQALAVGNKTNAQHEHGDPAESEVYFADVSSCCNMSVKNDNYYDDANQHSGSHLMTQHLMPQHRHQISSSSNEEYLQPHGGANNGIVHGREQTRDHATNTTITRVRLPFSQALADDFGENRTLHSPRDNIAGGTLVVNSSATQANQFQCGESNVQQPLTTKDVSRYSMCSVESEARTEFTDLSPSTPCSGGNQLAMVHAFAQANCHNGDEVNVNDLQMHQMVATRQQQAQPQHSQRVVNNFIATYPHTAEAQSHEAHRRHTKHLLNTDAHYEIINDQQQQQQQQQQHCHQRAVLMQRSGMPGSKRLTETCHKQKQKSKSRECLNMPKNNGSGNGSNSASTVSQPPERDWSPCSGNRTAVGGGNNGERQRL